MTGLLLLFGMFSVYVAGLVIIAGLANLIGIIIERLAQRAADQVTTVGRKTR